MSRRSSFFFKKNLIRNWKKFCEKNRFIFFTKKNTQKIALNCSSSYIDGVMNILRVFYHFTINSVVLLLLYYNQQILMNLYLD